VHLRPESAQLEWFARRAYGLPQLFFSVASYKGRPLLLNFEKSNCLYAQVCVRDDEWKRESDLILKLGAEITSCGLPLPTLFLNNGEHIDLLWHLEDPYRFDNAARFILSQKQMFRVLAAAGISVSPNTLSPSSLIQMVGTRNRRSKKIAMPIRYLSDPIKRARMEASLLEGVSVIEFERAQAGAEIFLELQAVFRRRVLSIAIDHQVNIDWLIFFGAALGGLCTVEQIRLELRALAESLENKKWHYISPEYHSTIEQVSDSAVSGLIGINGQMMDANSSNWWTMVAGFLQITCEEAASLGLKHLLPEGFEPDLFSRFDFDAVAANEAFGYDEMVSLEKILGGKVA